MTVRFAQIFLVLFLFLNIISCNTFLPQSSPESTMNQLLGVEKTGGYFEDAFWSLTTDDAIVYKYPMFGLYDYATEDYKNQPVSVRYSKRIQNMAEVSWGSPVVVVMEKRGLKWYISCVTSTVTGVEECYR